MQQAPTCAVLRCCFRRLLGIKDICYVLKSPLLCELTKTKITKIITRETNYFDHEKREVLTKDFNEC